MVCWCKAIDIKIKNCIRKHRNNHKVYFSFSEILDQNLFKHKKIYIFYFKILTEVGQS